jgi:homoserine O-acetyltransferase
MIGNFLRFLSLTAAVVLSEAAPAAAQQNASPSTTEGDFVAKNFKFRTGESLPELRLHYTTLGKPVRDAQGRVTNAVLLLHGTGGTGHQFLQPVFAAERRAARAFSAIRL